MLADAAQEVGGKLYILGGGWSIKAAVPSPMAIALKIGVPWTETNKRHDVRLLLLGEDGQPPGVVGPDGQPASAEVVIGAQLEVGRPPGLPAGTELDAPLAINVGAIPLMPGRGYVWRLEINGESQEHWQLPFRVQAG